MRHVFLFLTVFSLSAGKTWSEGFPTLKLGAGGRASALGLAYTALSDDGSAGFWNAAGLCFIGRNDVVLSVHRWIGDVQSEFVGFGWGDGRTGFGIHMLYTEVGGIEHRIVPSPTPLAVFSSHEFVGGISFARMIGRRISVGLTAKVLYEKIFFDEALGAACDIGFLWKVWDEGLRVGGVLQNMGKTGRLQDEAIALPFTGRLGLAFSVFGLGGKWVFVADGVKERDFPFHLHSGVEYGWKDVLYLRCGYQTGYETRDLTWGMGVAWHGFRLDYTTMPFRRGIGDSHRLTVGVGW